MSSQHSLTSQGRIFVRQSRRKVAMRMQGEPSCPSGDLPCSIVQCMERRTQHNALIRIVNGLWRKWTKTLVCSIRVSYKHPAKDVSVLRHGDDFATLATRTQIAEFEEDLSKHLLVKHIATLGPRPQHPDVCEVRFLNRVIRWVVPPFGKAPERIKIEADPRHSKLLIKNCGLQNKQQRSEHTRRTYERQFTHNQTFTTRFHIIPFQMSCVSRIYQLIELNCRICQ